jgi:cytochrome c-type biogenesis protein CcmH/NrfF
VKQAEFNILWVVGVVAALTGRFLVLWLQKRKRRKANEETTEKE